MAERTDENRPRLLDVLRRVEDRATDAADYLANASEQLASLGAELDALRDEFAPVDKPLIERITSIVDAAPHVRNEKAWADAFFDIGVATRDHQEALLVCQEPPCWHGPECSGTGPDCEADQRFCWPRRNIHVTPHTCTRRGWSWLDGAP